jgi:hypothetical protein
MAHDGGLWWTVLHTVQKLSHSHEDVRLYIKEEKLSSAKMLSSMGWTLVGTPCCDYNTAEEEESPKYTVRVWQIYNFYLRIGFDWWPFFYLFSWCEVVTDVLGYLCLCCKSDMQSRSYETINMHIQTALGEESPYWTPLRTNAFLLSSYRRKEFSLKIILDYMMILVYLLTAIGLTLGGR